MGPFLVCVRLKKDSDLVEHICKHFYVRGRVQGVFFRASTRKVAIDLGLTGWVQNRMDGCVEVFACGRELAMCQFEAWLWKGPELAHVEHVETVLKSYQHFAEFTVR